MKSNCKFCSCIISRRTDNNYDSIIYESQNFIVTASLGSLIPGWLLIIPKQHVLNFNLINQKHADELNFLYKKVYSQIERNFCKPTVFEHGPITENNTVGCGIDHAHLHLVPIEFSLSKAIDNFKQARFNWNNLSKDINIWQLDLPSDNYYYFKEPNNKSAYTIADKGISQFFRIVIADKLGMPDYYDYKLHHFTENINHTLELLLENNFYDSISKDSSHKCQMI